MFRLKEYKDKAKGLPDILNYASMIDNGVLLNKDGSLTAGMYYRASDIASMTQEDRSSLAKFVNAALVKLGDGWSMHIDCMRSQTDHYIDTSKNDYQNDILQILEMEREKYFIYNDHFESLFAITLTYLPPLKSVSKLNQMMIIDQSSTKKDAQQKILEEFKQKVNDIERSLSHSVFITPMSARKEIDADKKTHVFDELLEHINFCICGKRQKILLPQIAAMYLDSFIGTKPFYTGLRPQIEDKFIGIVAIDGFPSESYPNILNALSEMNFEYRFNTRFLFLDNTSALSFLNKYRRQWKQKVRGWLDTLLDRPSSRIDEHAQAMVNEVDDAIFEVNEGSVKYGFYTANIVIYNSDVEALEDSLNATKSTLEKLGFIARVEDINAVEAFLGTLPAHSYPNIRIPLINSLNLAHLLPLASIWAGLKYNPSDKFPPQSPPLMQTLTHGSTPFRLNLHVGDLGHTLIFGPTGAGKSTLLANLFLFFQKYPNAQVFAFDKGRSLLAPTLAVGGNHFDIAGEDSNLAFAPLANITTEAHLSWCANWIETCITLQLAAHQTLSPQQRKLIIDALRQHANNGSTSITDFMSNLQDELLRDAMHFYSIEGAMGTLLDSDIDNLSLSKVTTFEIEELMNLGEKSIVPTLLYIFYRIEKSFKGEPTLLILDEAWIALGHDVFKNKIREWLKVLRKANCAVVLATQSLSDAYRSGILDVLLESCPTRIFLPNNKAFEKGTSSILSSYDYYRAFGLNDAQIGIIADAIPKKEYYYNSALGNRLFDLALGEINLAFSAASDKHSIHRIKQLYNQFGLNWVYEWLKEKHIGYTHYQKGYS